MNGVTKMYWIHTLSPLHVGAGRGVGFIDLPIMREKVTGWPIVPGSTIKGVIADSNNAATNEQRTSSEKLKAAFGISDDDDTSSGANSGALIFTDARLVCLPVRSFYGTFAWITSPLTLKRLRRDLDLADSDNELPDCCDIGDQVIHLGHPKSVLKDNSKVYLEELDLNATTCDTACRWGKSIAQWLFKDDDKWRTLFQKRFAIVSSNIFDFLCETATQVDAHIRIQPDSKTVTDGALWYEESLPAESLLAGIVRCDRLFGGNTLTKEDLMKEYCTDRLNLQMGGKATVGKGQVRCIFGGGQQNGNQ